MKTLLTITLSFLFIQTGKAETVYCTPNENAPVKEMALFDGTPQESSRLAPIRNSSPEQWTFPKSKPRPIFVGCYYGKGEIAIYNKLPLDVVKCTRTSESAMDCI